MSRRKQATQLAVELLSKFDGYNESVQYVERSLESLTDEQFDQFMHALYNGESYLPYMAPILSDSGVTTEKNLQIAEEIGHKFFQRLWITDPATGQTHLTPKEYLVVDLPLKRLKQHLLDKISIPEDNRHIDDRSGQPTGDSKGAKLSYPELQVLHSQGLNQTIRELFKFRGGDEENFRRLDRDAIATGIPSMDSVEDPDSRAKASDVLSVLLKSAHIDNNL